MGSPSKDLLTSMAREAPHYTSTLQSGARLTTPMNGPAIEKALVEGFTRVVPFEYGRYVPEEDYNRRVAYFPRGDNGCALVRGVNWQILNTPFSFLDSRFDISVEIEKLKSKRDLKKDPPVIMDWGCGRSRGISGVAEYFRTHKLSNAQTIGLADQYYPEWEQADRDVEIIWDQCDSLPRHLGHRPADMIYSYQGIINHLYREGTSALGHLSVLKSLLRPGGVIKFDHCSIWDSVLGRVADLEFVKTSSHDREENYEYRRPLR